MLYNIRYLTYKLFAPVAALPPAVRFFFKKTPQKKAKKIGQFSKKKFFQKTFLQILAPKTAGNHFSINFMSYMSERNKTNCLFFFRGSTFRMFSGFEILTICQKKKSSSKIQKKKIEKWIGIWVFRHVYAISDTYECG